MKGFVGNVWFSSFLGSKETTLERAAFTLSAVTVCNRGKVEENVFFLSLQFLSAVVPEDSSKDRLSASRSGKLRPTGPEGSSF